MCKVAVAEAITLLKHPYACVQCEHSVVLWKFIVRFYGDGGEQVIFSLINMFAAACNI